jgi:hypothetical protein
MTKRRPAEFEAIAAQMRPATARIRLGAQKLGKRYAAGNIRPCFA